MIKIPVTAAHIARGVRWNPYMCPLAHAIRAAFPDACRVGVAQTYAGVDRGFGRMEWDLALATLRRIRTYDITGEMKPFVAIFDNIEYVDAPPWWARWQP